MIYTYILIYKLKIFRKNRWQTYKSCCVGGRNEEEGWQEDTLSFLQSLSFYSENPFIHYLDIVKSTLPRFVTQQVRTCSALQAGFFKHTHLVSHQRPITPALGNLTPVLDSMDTCIYTFPHGDTHTRITKISYMYI